MKLKILIVFLTLILLLGCVPNEETEEKLLSSGVQYLGGQEKIIVELEKLQLDYEKPSTINLELEDYKLVIVEPNYIEKINKDSLIKALKENFYVFFINMEDSRLTTEQYFNTIAYRANKKDKIWAEQFYLKDGQLNSVIFSMEPNLENELLKWLQYFDEYKEESY